MSSSLGRGVLAALLLLSASTVAVAQPGPPLVTLPAAVQGEAALQALGATLPAVAAAHGKTVDEFARILRTDRTAWVDRTGRLFFVEEVPPEVQAADTAVPPAPEVQAATSYTATGVPILHSRPGSVNVLYLDFDGHTITGTAWNAGRAATLVATPYDTDGVPGTFGSAEQTAMERIWARVAEDYAPFQVDVTTEPPAAFTSTTGRVLVTRSVDQNGNAMPSSTAGGVAYVGVFGRADYPTYYSPALVYYNNLGGGREDYVAEASSHEFGHNVGLSHDGTSTTSYYAGAGTAPTSWAPIMGSGYGKYVTKFSKGEYAGANNFEDDVALIAARLSSRGDDVGNSNGAAAPLSVGGSTVAGAGIIGTTGDLDVWAFTTAAGTITLNVSPYRAPANTGGGNLDLKLELRDANNLVVASADPATDTVASLATSVPAGTYFLHVAPSFASGVYPLYGSVGQYAVSGTILASTSDLTRPTAALAATPASPASGGLATTITVVYQDNVAVNVATLDGADLVVTGPGGTTLGVSLTGLDAATNGSPRTATYALPAPGGSWDASDNGTYSIAVQANQVADTAGNTAVAGGLGSFTAAISVPSTPQTLYAATMATDPGWALGATWAYGVATATSGPAGSVVIGDTITGSGLYADGNKGALTATTPAFSTAGFATVTLDADTFLGVRRDDVARIEVGSGGTWTTVWSNGGTDVIDAAWTRRVLDISAVAANRGAVQVRFTLGPTRRQGKTTTVSFGWNVRGLVVTGR
jgi:hypothetical protein